MSLSSIGAHLMRVPGMSFAVRNPGAAEGIALGLTAVGLVASVALLGGSGGGDDAKRGAGKP